MKIALAQINPIIADIAGNTEKILEFISRADSLGADITVFPELSITGYPPMDLIENPKLVEDNLAALERICAAATRTAVVVGFISLDGERIYNSAAFIHLGKIIHIQHKSLLPTYDVFDELRYFSPAYSRETFNFEGLRIGLSICEDIWNSVDTGSDFEMKRYPFDPVADLASDGMDLLINISASPYVRAKNLHRREMVENIARKFAVPVIYVNQVGGNDSLIFDGKSFAVNEKGVVVAVAAGFEEDLAVYDTEKCERVYHSEKDIDDVEKALVLGLRDYVRKTGFSKVLLGLSGGIDSALTAAIAVQALGADSVMGVTMPSKFSSAGSVDDSRALAANLGIRCETVPIKALYDRYLADLSPLFTGMKADVTEENIQARIRGTILMALSNKFGALLLTTGNKSELAMGYCTLYGDMNGGLAVISDLPKTLVYELSEYINREREIIPRATIDKAPSAELRENQTDQDSLPPYDILDGILECYIERKMNRDEIVAQGYDVETVDFVLRTVDRNEYKRRQAAPGLKITSKAFGIGRRIPVVQKFKP